MGHEKISQQIYRADGVISSISRIAVNNCGRFACYRYVVRLINTCFDQLDKF